MTPRDRILHNIPSLAFALLAVATALADGHAGLWITLVVFAGLTHVSEGGRK